MISPPPPTPPPAPGPTRGPDAAPPWHADPLERDRFLDGEGSPEERALRQADLTRDPRVAERLEHRAAFLRLLASAQPAVGLHDAGLASRVAALLATEQSASERPPLRSGAPRAGAWRRRLLPGLAAAAVLLVAFVVWSGVGPRAAQAVHPAELAAQLLDWKPQGLEGAAGCAGGVGGDVLGFVLVQDGELEIRACDPDGKQPGTSRALLRRPEELPTLGFVAVPAPGAVPSAEVGITEIGPSGVVVFDVLDHGRRVYLALDAAALRVKHAGAGDRWTCAACHGSVRQQLPNPHQIVLRRAP